MQSLRDLVNFLPEQTLWFLLSSFLALALTLFLHFKMANRKPVYAGLFISITLAGFGFAFIDDFIHPWDEQFHALVAKNLISHPLHLTLIEDIKGTYDYRIWIYNHTWLHKQPLFLWQIAVSLKLFGTNIIALRLPSIVMFAVTTCFVFSISKRLLSSFFAMLAAVLFGYCGFSLDFISGVQGMDHNDIAFLFYVTASFWSWMKYHETKKLRYVILTGLFSGGAVLCKWLTGLIVFAGWGVNLLAFSGKDLKEWKNIFISFGICLLVFIPWQLYCLAYFPMEYKYELAYNSAHFFKAVENHGGSWNFYFDGMKKIYGGGDLMRIFVLLGLLMTTVAGIRKKDPLRLFSAVVFTGVYLFFMTAATKLHGYVLIVSGSGFIFLLTLFNKLFEYLSLRYNLRKLHFSIATGLVLLLLLLQFNSKGVIDRHNFKTPATTEKWKRDIRYASRKILRSAKYRFFLIKNADTPMIPAIRFMTGKSVYGWEKKLESPETLVIDITEKD